MIVTRDRRSEQVQPEMRMDISEQKNQNQNVFANQQLLDKSANQVSMKELEGKKKLNSNFSF